MAIDLPAPAFAGPQLPPRAVGKADDTMAETARAFEATFMSQIAKLMLESVEVNKDFGGGHGEEMFRGVMAEKLGTEMARHGGIGLAPHILEQMIHMQGGQS